MGNSYYLCTNKTIKSKVYEKVFEEKNNPSNTNLDLNNKNLFANNNHSNNSVIITKAKKINEYENIKSEKNIKSIAKYVLKNMLFPFLPEKQKLEIIIYNKDLQKKLDINIENYKRIARLFREGERNGKGEEYYSSGELRFEGEYLNGKKMEKEKNIMMVYYNLKENAQKKV